MENHTQNGISKLSEWNGEWKEEKKKIKKLNADNENDDDDFFLGDALEATNNSAYYKVCAVCGFFDKCIRV